MLGSGCLKVLGLGSCVAAVLSGMLGGARGVVAVFGSLGLLVRLGFWVCPGLVLVAVVGLVRSGVGLGVGTGGWVGRWMVAGRFLSIIFY